MYTETDIQKMHAALYHGCELSVLPFTITAMRQWHDFLEEMKTAGRHARRPFTLADLVAVLALMQEQKRNGTGWAIRPSKILNTPETIRDLVLETRKKLKLRARTAAHHAAAKPASSTSPTEQPASSTPPKPRTPTTTKPPATPPWSNSPNSADSKAGLTEGSKGNEDEYRSTEGRKGHEGRREASISALR